MMNLKMITPTVQESSEEENEDDIEEESTGVAAATDVVGATSNARATVQESSEVERVK